MVGILGSKVARRAPPPPPPSACDYGNYGNYPGYPCRDPYGRDLQRGGLPGCHVPPSAYEYPSLPSASSDYSLDESNENWSESTLIYFGVGLVTVAILSKFIQDLLKSPHQRTRSSPRSYTAFSGGDHGFSDKPSIHTLKDLFSSEPETFVILKTDDRKVIDNINRFKHTGLPPEEITKPAPKVEAKKAEKPKEEKKVAFLASS